LFQNKKGSGVENVNNNQSKITKILSKIKKSLLPYCKAPKGYILIINCRWFLKGKLQFMPIGISLGCEGLPGTNTLTYLQINEERSIKILASGALYDKTFVSCN
jgi:hypothetical protein